MRMWTKAMSRKSGKRGAVPQMRVRIVSEPSSEGRSEGTSAPRYELIYPVNHGGLTTNRRLPLGPLNDGELSTIEGCVAGIAARSAGFGGAVNSRLGAVIEWNRRIAAQSESCDELAGVVGLHMRDGRYCRITGNTVDQRFRHADSVDMFALRIGMAESVMNVQLAGALTCAIRHLAALAIHSSYDRQTRAAMLEACETLVPDRLSDWRNFVANSQIVSDQIDRLRRYFEEELSNAR